MHLDIAGTAWLDDAQAVTWRRAVRSADAHLRQSCDELGSRAKAPERASEHISAEPGRYRRRFRTQESQESPASAPHSSPSSRSAGR